MLWLVPRRTGFLKLPTHRLGKVRGKVCVEPRVNRLLLAGVVRPEDVDKLRFEVFGRRGARVQSQTDPLQRRLDSPVLVEHQLDQRATGRVRFPEDGKEKTLFDPDVPT